MTESLPPAAPPPPPPPPPPAAPPAPPPPPVRPRWLIRHRTPLILCAVALAAIGTGIGVAVAASSESSSAQGAAATSTTAPPSGTASGSTGKPTKARKGARVTIMSEAASSWTVRTKAGQTLMVTITPQTQFGTKKAPATVSQFKPGETVVIVGTVTNGALTAARIASPANPTPPTPSPSPATS